MKLTKAKIGRRVIKFDWENRFRCKPLPFQRGDKVKTPKGVGTVTAVGVMGIGPTVYRVGKKMYWFGFQLSLLKRAALERE